MNIIVKNKIFSNTIILSINEETRFKFIINKDTYCVCDMHGEIVSSCSRIRSNNRRDDFYKKIFNTSWKLVTNSSCISESGIFMLQGSLTKITFFDDNNKEIFVYDLAHNTLFDIPEIGISNAVFHPWGNYLIAEVNCSKDIFPLALYVLGYTFFCRDIMK